MNKRSSTYIELLAMKNIAADISRRVSESLQKAEECAQPQPAKTKGMSPRRGRCANVPLIVNLPGGSGVRTVEITPGALVEETTSKLAMQMNVKEGQWRLYAKPKGESTKALAPKDRLTPMANESYYFYPLP